MVLKYYDKNKHIISFISIPEVLEISMEKKEEYLPLKLPKDY